MKRYLLFLVAAWCFAGEVFVTYTFSGGRFGDNLTSYVHAKWVTHHYGCTLLYNKFEYGDQLKLSKKERPLKVFTSKDKGAIARFIAKRAHIFPLVGNITEKRLQRIQSRRGPFLYLEYFPEEAVDVYNTYYDNDFRQNIQVDWNDAEFLKVIRENVSPLKPLPLVDIDSDAVNIAIHFRRGSGYDDDDSPQKDPLKFPPMEYIVNQLKQCARIYADKKLFVYLFTDFNKPKEVIEELSSQVAHEQMRFAYNEDATNYADRTLSDFFSMMRFDCIIRSASSYSSMAAKISDCELDISPMHFRREGSRAHITQVRFRYKKEKLEHEITRVIPVDGEVHAFTEKI